eukprot:CAMPEP_0198204884 /NCGR_PEP_ID=MMETSP1445-20131203/8367_1 /TAXON_ID=36898 /ORGANISM="Pyramimonas sp., Strain CCMP2087" /LENGTH=745 /DNA_ID=CAMNT_0043876969 /DNA_START=68 /DNA_END=2305 /DNA_ORIENTATION=-
MAEKVDTYKIETEKVEQFLTTFVSEYDENSSTKYHAMLQEIANRTRRVLDVDLDDIISHFRNDDMVQEIKKNTRRYQSIFSDAADAVMPITTSVEYSNDDVIDVLMRQREAQIEQAAQAVEAAGQTPARSDDNHLMPPSLTRRYEVVFAASVKEETVKLRDVKAKHIGHMVVLKAIVTRVNDVRPMMQVATYTCEECGFEIYQEVSSSDFTPLEQCPSKQCEKNARKGQLYLQTRGSKFLKFQEVKVQELAEEVPVGSIPRLLNVQLKGELTRTITPGDVVDITGIFLPIQYQGFRAMKAGLVANVYLEALGVKQHKEKYADIGGTQTEEMKAKIREWAQDGDIYTKLARSLAPEIFGHEDVKKAIILLLIGGVGRTLPDGMKLRGDMHLCLVGDPGVAKSQLLKYVTKLAPRAVYTTGRGSSGVGLTASVMRDPVTSDMVLEGGALVLADMGVCCIDEFDKMEETDRTAIHEVMEQQTVSIAKAGITTTLNARTSVLAAANPAWGRYDTRKSPEANIAMPAALLSRFDLLWLILDRADDELDTALAQHVLHVHKHMTPPALDFSPMRSEDIRSYVAAARQKEPAVPEELAPYLATAYADMREEEADPDNHDKRGTYTTARTLLSILRMSQALARLRLAEEVAKSDVDEALRMMKMSKISLDDDKDKKRGIDKQSVIYNTLQQHMSTGDVKQLTIQRAKALASAKGITEDELQTCLEVYQDLHVWVLEPKGDNPEYITMIEHFYN